MNHRARCPSPSCGELFVVEERRLGRNTYCPACGVRMTARPAGIGSQLDRRQAQTSGSPGASIERMPLAVLLDNVRSLWNVGAIFRTADACGIERMFLTGITGFPPRPEIAKTALGAEEAVAWTYRAEALTAVEEIAGLGYEPVALERSPRSVALGEFAWPERTCLVVGNEVAGVSPTVLAACGRRVHVPMLGVKDSLNVAVAFGMAALDMSRAARNAQCGALR